MNAVSLVLLVAVFQCVIAARMIPFRASRPDNILYDNKVNQGGSESDHLVDIRSITNGGVNAEAYFSFDNKQLSFQSIREPLADTHYCDQIYSMGVDGSNVKLMSTGKGRCTCSFYYPDGTHMLYSSTQGSKTYGDFCPATPDQNYGYVWPIYKEMDIFRLSLDSGKLDKLTDNDYYDAETTISPTGDFAVFTSTRDGDLEIYSMDLDGSNVRRLTYTPGYDGGAVISYDGKMIAWRASRPSGQNLTDYLNLLELGLVMPDVLELYVMTDLNNPLSVVQLTNNGAANFAPYWLPDNSGLIFSSDVGNPGVFHLYTIKIDGSQMTQITFEGYFNSFPMFSFDGLTLAWESDRNTTVQGDMNVILANWKP